MSKLSLRSYRLRFSQKLLEIPSYSRERTQVAPQLVWNHELRRIENYSKRNTSPYQVVFEFVVAVMMMESLNVETRVSTASLW